MDNLIRRDILNVSWPAQQKVDCRRIPLGTMKDVFISYVDEDRDLAQLIASELEAAGCSAWYYQRDSLPGLSYLSQTRRAIDDAKCFLFVVSPCSLQRHHQVDKEVVHAHEAGKPIIPILRDVSFEDFKRARPEWHQAIGAVVGVELSSGDIHAVVPRLLAGFKALGITAVREKGDSSDSVVTQDDANSTFVVDETTSDQSDDDIAIAVVEEREDIGAEKAHDCISATFVHEHPRTGFLADLTIAESELDSSDHLRVAFSHQLVKPNPCVVAFQLGSDRNPVQYFRFPNLMQGYPVVLRVYWLARLPSWSTFRKSFGVPTAPPIRVTNHRDDFVANLDSAGIIVEKKFQTIIPPGQHLPHVEKKRFRTVRDNQRAISVTPALRYSGDRVQHLPRLRLPVPMAPAGVAWMEFTFRIDPDGRFTLFARDPLYQMAVRDLLVVG
ncbi:TIR domain-containing protein [Candidatus Parcubacteria bacterium]|nr:MAG: TIR domain-containing protein [Candidatus Parcubacteria bacterium]